MRSLHTHYDNLKVPRDATPTAIRAAYRRLSQKHHPDRNPGDAEAARVMTLINVAYRVLSDPAKRADHDRWIARKEAVAEPELTPAGAYTSPPPPPPPRPTRPSRPRKPKIDRSDMPEGLRQLARGAVFYVLTMLIFSPFLITVAAWWKAPEPQPVSRTILHTHQSSPLAPSRLAAALRQLPDLSGVYRLVGSDNHGLGPSPREYDKGKLVIRKLNEDAYVVLEAVTVRGAGTFGRGHAYRIYPDGAEPGKVTLAGRSGSRFIGDTERLVQHAQGANFKETLWWKREPAGFKDKYLDRGIEQAEWRYRVRVERGLERGG